jgi:hypothetical protein
MAALGGVLRAPFSTTVKPLSVFGPKSRGENGMSRI